MTNRTLIQDLATQINHEIEMAVHQAGQANDVALDHIQRAIKQIDNLRYHIFQMTHVSGVVKRAADSYGGLTEWGN